MFVVIGAGSVNGASDDELTIIAGDALNAVKLIIMMHRFVTVKDTELRSDLVIVSVGTNCGTLTP